MSHWNTILDFLAKEHGVAINSGLSDSEIESCQREFAIEFPPDLREFLQCGLPVSDRFPDWRNGSREELKDWLRLPLEGILFDVEYNEFWLPEWGARPDDLESAAKIVRERFDNAPKLIPIYAHRMMPDRPNKIGNPVFSVHQTDIINYGCDLSDYFIHEFSIRELDARPILRHAVRTIDFWDPARFATRCEREPVIFDGSNKISK